MKNLKLNVIHSETEQIIGTVEMRADHFEKLESFGDHENKPLNIVLNAVQIADLNEQNPPEVDPDPAFADLPARWYNEDDDIRLEVA